jgi:hypothetical protein
MNPKSKLILQITGMLLLTFGFQFLFALPGAGSVMGRVTDPDTKAPAADVTVIFENQGTQKVFITNDSGYYYASNLPVGIYTVTASYMSVHNTVIGVRVGDDDQKILDIALSAAIVLNGAVIDGNPIIDPIGGDKIVIPRVDFKNEPITKIDDITASQPGVVEVNGVFYVHGAREGGVIYYIDGAPVMVANIPLCGLETYTMYSGFIPPKYGDAVGGVVVLETRNYFSEN